MSEVHRYRLGCVCPRCGRPPAIRVPQDVREMLKGDPDRFFQSFQCQNKACQHIYDIYLRDFYRSA